MKNGSVWRTGGHFLCAVGLGLAFAISDVHSVRAQELVCARVRIQIEQELTLERQAFEARMTINNGLDIALNDVTVQVAFSDEEGNEVLASSNPNETNPNVKFYLAPPVGLTSTIAGQSQARITWLIIPTRTAGGTLPQGKLYYVGAELSYRVGEATTPEQVTVSPDYIFVKPLPELELDYFLPVDVVGDDPRTTDRIEPVQPFTLGVRVKNVGAGVAKKLKIESSQPKIVENDQGLLIGFQIIGTEVNGRPAVNSLLADFGDIAPASSGTSGVARWLMTCSLAGKFVEFSATISHADELGGALTSLIPAGNLKTHFLLRDVWVDLPGRDDIRDFLAFEAVSGGQVGGLAVYESNATENDVNNRTPAGPGPLPQTGGVGQAVLAEDPGFSYVKYVDPFQGSYVLESVTRSDGKRIRAENAWFDRAWNTTSKNWEYWFHLFDVANVGAPQYVVRAVPASSVDQAPEIGYLSDRFVAPGEQVGFLVRASDSSGTPPQLRLANPPAGALVTNLGISGGQVTAAFHWTPGTNQIGVYPLRWEASDGVFTSRRTATVTVGGGRAVDAWKLLHFPDGMGSGDGEDFDEDGLTTEIEYVLDTNPTVPDARERLQFGVDQVGAAAFASVTWVQRTNDPSLGVVVMGGYTGRSSAAFAPEVQEMAVSQDGVPEGLVRRKVRDSVPIDGVTGLRRYLWLDAEFN